jgi:cyclopropane-fatty-acyl-phospholipid synthase
MKSIALIDKTALVDKKVGVESRQAPASVWDRQAKQLLLKALNGMTRGHLTIEDQGEIYTFGQPAERADVIAHIHVQHPSAYRQVLVGGTVGSGEAYMLGAWTSPDIVAVIRVFVLNMQTVSRLDSGFSWLMQSASRLLHRSRANSKRQAKLNIAAHYDLGNDFFKLFLDETMLYSSAIYPTETATLHQASCHKLAHIGKRLELCSNDHLLEIGSGWGGLAIFMAKTYGCRVTTITLSPAQCAYATDWVAREGLADRVDVKLCDYRDIGGQYDKIVSIEMIEAVGYRYFSTYFSTLSQRLKPNGKCLIQAITISDQRYAQERDNVDFIQRYIFPGGCLPSLAVIANHVCADTDMQLVGLEDITRDYARTLAAWRQAFLNALPAVKQQGFDDVFIRMWDFYLAYCEGGFRERVISTVQVLLAKPDCRSLPAISH